MAYNLIEIDILRIIVARRLRVSEAHLQLDSNMSQERESLEPHVDQIQRRGGDGHVAMKPEGQLKGGDARAGIGRGPDR